MINYAVQTIHNISRPGQTHAAGDVLEIECTGGFIKEVNPRTRECGARHQRFRVEPDGETLTPVHDSSWSRVFKPNQEQATRLERTVNTAMRVYWPLRRMYHP